MGDFRKTIKKIWQFIWEDESVLSWIVNIILAFVLIKFVFFPLLGVVLGTSHPIVAVVSGSMEHDGNFDAWWNSKCCKTQECTDFFIQADLYTKKYNLSKEEFGEFGFRGGFNKGDLMILYSPDETSAGDILVFQTPNRTDPIIHRLVKITETEAGKVFTTKGDHNCGSADFEQAIPEHTVVGKALFRIPLLGWIKIGFVELLHLFGL